ncbi:hypothetical protein MHBO_000512 [Bonamia ostreae]|uniref:Plectin/eS10 N-terminal domain-containing protein n=1 Tax=Bonamia ostreae TaxID=126728 RepID=A0ABV2AFV8_9EUKA
MLISKKNQRSVYAYLFQKGTLVVENNAKLSSHPQIPIPNLHVRLLMRSLKSRGLVDSTSTWKRLYYTLNDDGIQFIREFLHLPTSAIPDTLSKPVDEQKSSFDQGQRRKPEKRDAYRKQPATKTVGAPEGFKPEFGDRPQPGA